MADLLREAARNHQLERASYAEQAEAKSKRRDGQFERHLTKAERFLADPTLRALSLRGVYRACNAVNYRPSRTST